MPQQLAHVSYVLSDQEQVVHRGADYAFISQPFLEPQNLIAIAAVIACIAAVIFVSHKWSWLRDRVRYFRGRARSYQDFVPWVLRFSLGVALIGAGSQQALISPAVQNQPTWATFQLILGFLLITGFLLTPTTIAAIVLSLGALVFNPELLNNLEIIGALLALCLLGQAKPGLDDLIGMPIFSASDKARSWMPFILRLSLGTSLVIMAITEKLLNPHLFGAVVETYNLTSYLPFSTGMWVASATLIELCLGLALLLGLHTRVVSAITFLVLSLTFVLFGEAVYAHVTIFGALFVLIVTGGGQGSLDNVYAKRRQNK